MSITPERFRKKPVTIEAVQTAIPGTGMTWTDDEADEALAHNQEIVDWIRGHGGVAEAGVNYIEIETLEGAMKARPGGWIIRGLAGEFYPCAHDIFVESYERA